MKNVRTELIVDIDSASVGACFATFAEGVKPTLQHIKRNPIRIDSADVRGSIQTLALQALKKTLEGMPHHIRPEAAHVVFAAPWYAAEIKTVLSESKKPLKIGRATVTHALKMERSEDAKKIRTGRVSIESVVNQVFVNGYPTSLHKAVLGTRLEVHLYESEADADFVKGVTDIIHAAVPRLPMHFHTFPLVAFAALQLLRGEEHFIFAHIGGEITDVIVGDRGALRFIDSFPKGATTLLRDIAGRGSIHDAASRLTLFARNELSAEEMESFSKTFSQAVSSWRESYNQLMERALANTPIPRTLFLMADKEPLPWFEKALLIESGGLSVLPVPVLPSFFEKEVALGEDALYDPFLSLQAVFFSIKKDALAEM